ncbi:glycyl-radical enzyme activating protein [Lacticaseibacillus baoqingensis]|uniref:Glycyl-radical enzyme activating protein n=1 Tax=Lacticaseibacillus baoqingensis TaxID=2486013 RepID=A0ABW4EBX8_9LACO|nr:glycyl-radical enzyme activating protein [Lacticaseibacillus baoqingensis]
MELQGCIFNIQRFSIHDGPGIRTSVFLKGCPLRCKWCANPESQSRKPEPMWDNAQKCEIITGDYYNVEDVMQVIRRDVDYYHESGGGVTVTGGEALAQADFTVALLKQCQSEGFDTACETCAYASGKEFQDMLDHLDHLIMDVKHWNSLTHRQWTNGSLDPILNNVKLGVASGKDMLVRIPVIPGFNDSLDDAEHFGTLLADLNVPHVELLPFHQFGKNKYHFLKRDYAFENVAALQQKDLVPFQTVLQEHGLDCRIGG